MSSSATTERRQPLPERYQRWVGQRVVVGLTSYHYLCGTWLGIDAAERARFRIGGRELTVPLRHIATVLAAEPLQADFYK